MANNIEIVTVTPFTCIVEDKYHYPNQKMPAAQMNAAHMAEVWVTSFKELKLGIDDKKLRDIWNSVSLQEVLPYALVCAMQGDIVFARAMQVRSIFMDKFLRSMRVKDEVKK